MPVFPHRRAERLLPSAISGDSPAPFFRKITYYFKLNFCGSIEQKRRTK